MRIVSAFVGLLALSGCVTPSAGSDDIVVTSNNDQVRGCRLLKQVDADQIFVGGMVGRDAVRQKLRNAAAQSGATHVLMVTQPNVYGSFSSGTGELYRC